MLIDIQIPMNVKVPQQLASFERAEELGFDGAGVPDHMEHGHDVYSTLALASTRTRRIALFPCVSNPVTRHPWVLANVMHTMDECAPGRFRMVIGAGDSAVMHIGKRPAKVEEMRSAISSIRKLLRGEPVSFNGKADEGIIGIQPPAPPVIVAAGGPRMTELAGEIGDEVFLLTGFDEQIVNMARGHLEAGAARSGRALDGFKLSHYTVVRIENDKEAAAEYGRKQLLIWLKMGFFRASLQALGVPAAALDAPEDIPTAELDRLHRSFFLIGPIEELSERIQEIGRSGSLDRMICVASGPDGWEPAATAIAAAVLPKVR